MSVKRFSSRPNLDDGWVDIYDDNDKCICAVREIYAPRLIHLLNEKDYYKKLYFTLKDTLFEAFEESNNKYPWLFEKEKIEEFEKAVNRKEEELKP